LLALGDFTGEKARPKLNEREIQSIMPGMSLASFMKEMEILAPITQAGLRTVISGTLTGTVRGELKEDLGGQKAIFKFTGTGRIEGIKSAATGGATRGGPSGNIVVNGLGDFAGNMTLSGTAEVGWNEPTVTFSGPIKLKINGKATGTIAGVVDVAGHPCTFAPATAEIDGSGAVTGTVTADVPVNLAIPITDIKAFTPDRIAGQVPEISRLLVIRYMITKLREYVANRPDLSDSLKAMLRDRKTLGELNTWLKDTYPTLMLEPGKAAATTSPTTPAAGTATPAANTPAARPATPAPHTPPPAGTAGGAT
jgi:predicted component of type VI protein secretion system